VLPASLAVSTTDITKTNHTCAWNGDMT
jgi:hypothetical protein